MTGRFRRALRLAAFGLTSIGLSPFAEAHLGGGYLDSGLLGEYFANTDLTGSPAFTRRDVRIDFQPEAAQSWAGSRTHILRDYPKEAFSVRWSGALIPRFSETYTFRTIAEDGVRIFVRPVGSSTWTQLVNNWPAAGQSATTTSATYAMSAGQKYDFRVEYRNLSGTGLLRVLWSSPSTQEEVIDPAAAVSINHTYTEDAAADAFRAGRIVWDLNPPLDSKGWPQDDCDIIISETNRPNDIPGPETGDMRLTLTGKSDLIAFGNCSIVSPSYNAATNTTSAIVRGVDNNTNVTAIRFRNTDRDGVAGGTKGFTNLKIMRLPFANAPEALHPDTIFHPDIIEAYSRYTALRFQRINDQARSWSERCPPDYAFPRTTVPFVYNARYGETTLRGSTYMCHEEEIMLCNEAGADYFVSIPHLASYSGTANYIRNFALLIRYGSDQSGTPYTSAQANPYHPPLNPNLRVYLEIGNELWNSARLNTYSCFFDLQEEVVDLQTSGSPDFAILNFDNVSNGLDSNGRPLQLYTLTRRWWALRLMHISNEFRTVFGDAEMPGNGNRDPRVRPYFTWQYGNMQDTASTGLNFLNNYFNNGAGNYVSTPRPPNYFFWSGGGAGYYSVSNREGLVSPNPVQNFSFESPAVTGASLRPTGGSWIFSGTAGIAKTATRTPAITAGTAVAPGNTSGGWYGMRFTVGASPVTVYDLGRYVVSGNTGTHNLRLVRADGVQIASTSVNTTGATADTFVYGLCVPVTLAANTSYYLFSNETAGGNRYGSEASTVTPASGFTVDGAASGTLAGTTWSLSNLSTSNRAYGPVSLRTRAPELLASGTALNQPDPVAGSQMAWLQSVNGVGSSMQTTLTLPATQQDNTYSFLLRWMNRHLTSEATGDQMEFKVFVTVNGVETDISPGAPRRCLRTGAPTGAVSLTGSVTIFGRRPSRPRPGLWSPSESKPIRPRGTARPLLMRSLSPAPTLSTPTAAWAGVPPPASPPPPMARISSATVIGVRSTAWSR